MYCIECTTNYCHMKKRKTLRSVLSSPFQSRHASIHRNEHVGQQKQIMPPFEDKNSQPHDNRVTFLNSIRVKITAVHKNNMPNKKTLDQINVGLSAQLRCISLHFSSQIHYKQKYPASLFQMMRKTRPQHHYTSSYTNSKVSHFASIKYHHRFVPTKTMEVK